MNIFYLHSDPRICAEYHCDKHVVKMILEYAQLLSTAHRVLDGTMSVGLSKTGSGRRQTKWILPDDRESILYSATHINHPSAQWARQSNSNYIWLTELLEELCCEYTYRYGKIHKVESSGLAMKLKYNVPKNILHGEFTDPTPAMPDDVKLSDSLSSYRNYYSINKAHLASWKKREMPYWYKLNGE